jgi:exodeoxyribonuclease VII small subunit
MRVPRDPFRPHMSKPSRQGSETETKPDAKPAGPGFEKALAELEKIVQQMETGKLSLEQSLAAHKRGLELAKYCQERLEAAQQQVQVLEGEVLKPLGGASFDPLAASESGERD